MEERLWKLTEPINGQYPRPWMTTLARPADAKIFIVGYNQATEYPVAIVGKHRRFIDAQFNRNGQTCRALYSEVRKDDGASATRDNIDLLTSLFARVGLNEVLETNVICYSTKKGADLSDPVHRYGRERGSEIFRAVLEGIRPPIVIIDGKAALKTFVKLIGARGSLKQMIDTTLSPEKTGPVTIAKASLESPNYKDYNPLVYAMRSLGQPEFNKWKARSAPYFKQLIEDVAHELSG